MASPEDLASGRRQEESLTGRRITHLLAAWRRGDEDALQQVMDRVYGELRAVAGNLFRHESGGHTLQPTALVNEAFLRLVDQERIDWKSRAQFFAVAARIMRRVLVDHARARAAAKRGGVGVRVTLEDASPGLAVEAEQLLAIHDALERLARLDPQQARIVELRYFSGLTIAEVTRIIGVSQATVKREWSAARAWLLTEVGMD